jgi:hypothetical protein
MDFVPKRARVFIKKTFPHVFSKTKHHIPNIREQSRSLYIEETYFGRKKFFSYFFAWGPPQGFFKKNVFVKINQKPSMSILLLKQMINLIFILFKNVEKI